MNVMKRFALLGIVSCIVMSGWSDTRESVLSWFASNQFGQTPVASDVTIDGNVITCFKGSVRITLDVHIPPSASQKCPVPVFVMAELYSDNHISASAPVSDLLAKGYAYIRYNVNDVAANVDQASESATSWRTGVLAACCPSPRKADSWGAIGAWAWGFSRVVDWIEANPLLDPTRVAVVGHSRGGKAALWAAAQDMRIAMAVSSCSGCGGAQQLRLKTAGAEMISDITSNYPYWFARNFANWAGREAELPYDAADLLGLLKGRLAYVSSGSTDAHAGPTAETAAVELAREAGVTVGRHVRTGGHEITASDWQQYIAFADEHLKMPDIEAPDYTQMRETTLTVAGYTSGSIADFPVLVRISPARIPGFSYANCRADGSDVFFMQGETSCPHEIDTWDPSGESLVWVRLKDMSDGAKFTMRFGGSPVENDSTKTWTSGSSSYVGVWHMNTASGNVLDATGSGHAAVPKGSQANALSVGSAGCIGLGRRNGSGDHVAGSSSSYLSVQNSENLDLGGHFTISGWVKISGTGDYWPRFISNKESGEDSKGFEIHGSQVSGKWVMRGPGGLYMNEVQNPWKKGEWVHESFVYDGETYRIYANGVLMKQSTITGGTVLDGDKAISIGSNSTGSEWALYGVLDEFRLRRGAASADWIAAEYATVNDSGFLTAGQVRLVDPDAKVVQASLPTVDVFVDGESHGPEVSVTDPATGATVEWSVEGGAFSSERPIFVGAGFHRVACRVSADGYLPRLLQGVVRIRERQIAATLANVQIAPDEAYEIHVTDPAVGAVVEWSTDGLVFVPEKPELIPGQSSRIYCRVTADGYRCKVLSALIQVFSAVVYVSPDGSATEPYDTPEKALTSVKAAVEVAAGGKIIVLPGEYAPPTVAVPSNTKIVGPSDRSAAFIGEYSRTTGQMTLMSGAEISGCTFVNCWTPVASEASTVVSNCTFRRCAEPVAAGGLLTHCDIVEFGGEDRGVDAGRFAVKIVSSSALISHCLISNGWNRAKNLSGGMSDDVSGGTVYAYDSYPIRIEDTDILYTTNIITYGATVYSCLGSPATLTRCRIVGNAGRVAVARLSHQGINRQELIAENCLFADNKGLTLEKYDASVSSLKFAMFFCYGKLTNCTLADNDARIVFSLNSDNFSAKMEIVNCVMQGNAFDTWEDAECGKDGSLRCVSYSLFPDATGENNIVGPAKFANTGRDPYRLDAGSPGINAGADLNWTKADHDLSGRSRLVGRHVDMGCYETGCGLIFFIR